MALSAIVVGGSVGGLSVAHALRKAGLDVTVFEKASSVSAAGAGLGLDQTSQAVLESFGLGEEFRKATLPMPKEINRGIAADRTAVVAAQDNEMKLHSTHWIDIHSMLRSALPKGVVKNGHRVTNITQSSAEVAVEVEGPDSSHKFAADLLIGADGSMSETWRKFNPHGQRRYSGYCAWRGVMRESENPKVAAEVRKEYKDMGRALYFDVLKDSHAVVYELPDKLLNWLWYVNQPEPQLKGSSVTVKAEPEQVEAMHRQADASFPPALASLMKATASPFINAIFDREPLQQWVWGQVSLMGEAAHPTTPHGLRSTNMAIADAGALGEAFASHKGDIGAALKQYQDRRLAATTREVLFSRWLGQLKQGIADPSLDWTHLPADVAHAILQRNMPSFDLNQVIH